MAGWHHRLDAREFGESFWKRIQPLVAAQSLENLSISWVVFGTSIRSEGPARPGGFFGFSHWGGLALVIRPLAVSAIKSLKREAIEALTEGLWAGTWRTQNRAECGKVRSFKHPNGQFGHEHGEGFNSSLKGLSPPLQVFTLSRMEQDGQVLGPQGFRALTVRAKVSNVDCEGPRSQPAVRRGALCPVPGSGGKKAGGCRHAGLSGLSGSSGTWGRTG